MSEPIVIVVAGEARPFQKKVASWTAKDGRFGTHAYDTSKYAGWKDQARYTASQVMKGRPPLAGQVDLKVKVYLPIPESWSNRKKRHALAGMIRPAVVPDWDNLGKAAGDALEMIVFRNDKQVVDGQVQKWYSDRPRVEIEVRETELIDQVEPELRLEG
jgi:Holliday junction resolvase RusA-like endonuclease